MQLTNPFLCLSLLENNRSRNSSGRGGRRFQPSPAGNGEGVQGTRRLRRL